MPCNLLRLVPSNHMGDLCCDCQRSFFVLEYCHILGLVAGEQITIAASCFFNQALRVTSDRKGGIPHFYLDIRVQTTIAACCILIKPQVSQVTVEEGAHISILILVCRLRSQRAAFFIKPQASQVTAGEGAHITISFQSKCWWGQDSHS
jgi:hypothetical protein